MCWKGDDGRFRGVVLEWVRKCLFDGLLESGGVGPLGGAVGPIKGIGGIIIL